MVQSERGLEALRPRLGPRGFDRLQLSRSQADRVDEYRVVALGPVEEDADALHARGVELRGEHRHRGTAMRPLPGRQAKPRPGPCLRVLSARDYAGDPQLEYDSVICAVVRVEMQRVIPAPVPLLGPHLQHGPRVPFRVALEHDLQRSAALCGVQRRQLPSRATWPPSRGSAADPAVENLRRVLEPAQVVGPHVLSKAGRGDRQQAYD